MQIKNISFSLPLNVNSKVIKPVIKTHSQPLCDTVSFKGKQYSDLSPQEKLERALNIVDALTQEKIMNLSDRDIEELEGIQYGLKTFEGMSFREIYFILCNLGELSLPVYRDCAGMCPACNVNGRPAQFSKPENLRRMDYEDFENFTNDLKEISTRLNFDLFDKAVFKNIKDNVDSGIFTFPGTALFYDSDGKDIWLKDKDGNVHEFPELNKKLYESTGIRGIFDTAGWSKNDKKTQARMERLVDYYSDLGNQQEIDQVNISFNTYNGLLQKANEYKEKGDFVGYERMKKVYTSNIANALYTFTPLVDEEFFSVFTKAVDYGAPSKFDDYKKMSIFGLAEDVIYHLIDRYEEDLKNKNYKYVRSKEDIYELIKSFVKIFGVPSTVLSPSARENIFSDLNKEKFDYIKDNKNATYDDVVNQRLTNILIDMNGKVYLSNDLELYETDMQLNFKNKDKQTKQIYPLPEKRILRVKEKSFR